MKNFRRLAAAVLLGLCVLQALALPQEKPRPVRHDAARLRRALVAAFGGEVEIVRDEVTRRSDWHGAGGFWLVHVRPKRAGHFSLKYTYKYDDPVNKTDPLYTHVEHTIAFNVGPRGCWRRPEHMTSYFVPCLGDTVILPVVLDAYKATYTDHTFVFTARPSDAKETAAGPEEWAKTLMRMEEDKLSKDPVENPLAEHLKYVGSRVGIQPHRASGFTANFYATFEAVKPGRFNLEVSTRYPEVPPAPAFADRKGGVPVIVVERGTPVTWLAAQESVHGYSGRFGSHSGNSYLTSPVILQPGERLTLRYGGFSRRGRDPESKLDVAELEARVRPAITRLPFHVDPADSFNEWIVNHPPYSSKN